MLLRSLLLALSLVGTATAAVSVKLATSSHPALALGLSKLTSAAAHATGDLTVTVTLDPAALGPEAFSLTVNGTTATLTGGSPTGAMYGLFDLAEMLRANRRVADVHSKSAAPHTTFRALKFNLPWDAYRTNEAITQHTATCRDPAFWAAFLDMMAENRFNALTLWNFHPFNFMIRAKNFPEACEFSDAELAEWQTLFHTIFRLAKERGIETYIVNWNIFVSPSFAQAHQLPGRANLSSERGLTPAQDALVKRYNRESVTQILQEYPDLTGIGLSLGEAMGDMTAAARQQWMLDTLIAGAQAAGRPVKLIHRVPFSAGLSNGGTTSRETEQLTRTALESITGIELPIIVEAKFNWSHAHSTPKLIKTHGGPITDVYWNPPPDHFRMAWMMRNEDFFTLRWGDPDFIREVLARNGGRHVTGYFVGSECYIPALDYFTKNTAARSWHWAFERQWLFYQLWGRLLYDAGTPDAVFEQAFTERYGALGPRLFTAWRVASRVPLRLTSYINIDNDKSFYAEGFLARDGVDSSQFMDLNLMLKKETLDPDYLSAAAYAKLLVEKKAPAADLLTPIALADLLDSETRQVLGSITNLTDGGNEALRQELTDLRAWAGLGRYFAAKLRAAVALAQFRLTKDVAHQAAARLQITAAIGHWEEIIAATEPVYRTVPLTHLHYFEPGSKEWNRVKPETKKAAAIHDNNYFSWVKLLPFVKRDLDIINATP